MEKENKTLYELVNPEFTFKFAGKEYSVKGANLEKLVQFRTRGKEISGDSSEDVLLASYAIYLVLKDSDSSITEEFVLKNTPATVDTLDVLTTLGFMSPQKMEQVKQIQESMTKKLTSDKSS